MAYFWAIHDIVLVHSHHPLISNMFFCKIVTTLAFISLHFIVIAISLRKYIRLRYVSIAIILHHASIFPIVLLATVLAETVGLTLATVLCILCIGTVAKAIRG